VVQLLRPRTQSLPTARSDLDRNHACAGAGAPRTRDFVFRVYRIDAARIASNIGIMGAIFSMGLTLFKNAPYSENAPQEMFVCFSGYHHPWGFRFSACEYRSLCHGTRR
jgi:hypothetical protein